MSIHRAFQLHIVKSLIDSLIIMHVDGVVVVVQAAGDVRFDDGLSGDDYRIIMESANCTIESFTANEIDCRPPLLAPAPDPRFSENSTSTLDCHRNDRLHMQV